jgi:hypothetical protein
MRVNGRWWRVVSLGLSLGVGWGSLSQAQPNARIPDSTTPPLLVQATPAPTTLQEQIRELEAQIEAARQRGDQAEVERLQADSPASITVIDRDRHQDTSIPSPYPTKGAVGGARTREYLSLQTSAAQAPEAVEAAAQSPWEWA